MRSLWLTAWLLAGCNLLFGQLESGSLTITATRTMALQPDQAVIATSVLSGLEDSLEEILGTVADAGIGERDFSGVTIIPLPTGSRLRWDFSLAVPIAQIQDTISSFRGHGLGYTLRGVQVSPEKTASAQCPRADLIADAAAQARKIAVAAGITVGSILSVAEGGSIRGAVFPVLTLARSGDFSFISSMISLPPLPMSQPMICSVMVKFALNR